MDLIKNRTEKLKKILDWAESSDEIRVLLQTSSLTNPNAPTDVLSDLNIELAVRNPDIFLTDDSWLSLLGEPIIILKSDPENFRNQYAMRMVLYADYVKADFRIYSLEKFREQTQKNPLFEDWDIGYRVWIDKDHLTQCIPIPSYQAFVIRKPTEKEFQSLLHDVWWDLTYIIKSLWRDELFYAKFMESNIRSEYMEKLLEWHIGSLHNWKITSNKHGRLFKNYLSPKLWKKVEATFSGVAITDNWKALFASADLIHELGTELAQKLNYTYPLETEQKIRGYAKYIKELKKI